MFSEEERYITIDELDQGTKFTSKDNQVMKLPECCKFVDQVTMKVEE